MWSHKNIYRNKQFKWRVWRVDRCMEFTGAKVDYELQRFKATRC